MGARYESAPVLALAVVLLVFKVDGQTPSCCILATGSCRIACEKISLVDLGISDDRQQYLKSVNLFCSELLVPFWTCINETLKELDNGKDFYGRPCCNLPQSLGCRLACLRAQRKDDLLSRCRHSDEVPFFVCVQRQDVGEKCCRNAVTPACKNACKQLFALNVTSATQIRKNALRSCADDTAPVLHCVRNYAQLTPVENPIRYLHCCDRSDDAQCRMTCKNVLRTQTTGLDIVDSLIYGGCRTPLPHDPLWQCFLTHSDDMKPNLRALFWGTLGMDLGKLQCCYLAATVKCHRLCVKTFSNEWSETWEEFHRVCQYQLAESDMIHCLAEVDEPCELGCSGLGYCTNFNFRPTELFRSCTLRADQAARDDVQLWQKGVIRLPMMDIPVQDITRCHPEMWKAVACVLQIKPCHQENHVNMICKSDCVAILSQCVDKKRLSIGLTPTTICEMMSPPGEGAPCISLSTYLAESPYSYTAEEVTHPCKPHPCNSSEVCLINHSCRQGQPCSKYFCVPGCRVGEMSQLVVPRKTYVNLPSSGRGPHYRTLCHCNHFGELDNCFSSRGLPREFCLLSGRKIAHNTHFHQGCAFCTCYSGQIRCSRTHCTLSEETRIIMAPGLPCNCPDHYVPVCGNNGKTYPSPCHARCAGLDDGHFQSGSCTDVYSAHSEGCVPFKKVCITLQHKCPQLQCVQRDESCDYHQEDPVCDTDGREHKNLCWLLRKNKKVAYPGKCKTNCRNSGLVCGHNGETYSSECAALADRVSVDYSGPCMAVGRNFEGLSSTSLCTLVSCRPLMSPYCSKIIPPDSCCPICGGVLKLVYSPRLVDQLLNHNGSTIVWQETVVVRKVAEKMEEHVKTAECEVFAYLSLEGTVVVVVEPTAFNSTMLQVQACMREAKKLQSLVHQSSPIVMMELPISFMIAAVYVNPAPNSTSLASELSLAWALPFLLLIFTSVHWFIHAR